MQSCFCFQSLYVNLQTPMRYTSITRHPRPLPLGAIIMNILFYHSALPPRPAPFPPAPPRVVSHELDTERKISSQGESELCTEFALFERTKKTEIKEVSRLSGAAAISLCAL